MVLIGALFVLLAVSFTAARHRAVALDRTSASLRASEARYSSLVNLSHDGIAALDRELRFTFVNPRLDALLGYPPGYLVGPAGGLPVAGARRPAPDGARHPPAPGRGRHLRAGAAPGRWRPAHRHRHRRPAPGRRRRAAGRDPHHHRHLGAQGLRAAHPLPGHPRHPDRAGQPGPVPRPDEHQPAAGDAQTHPAGAAVPRSGPLQGGEPTPSATPPATPC